MKLVTVRNYKGVQYPPLATYLKQQQRRGMLPKLTLAAALAALANLLGGCTTVS